VKAWAILEIPRAHSPDETKRKIKPASLRKQLESVERQGGGHDARLVSVWIPDGFGYLWELFWNVRRGASAGFSGVSVTYRDLSDYQSVTGVSLDAFEADAIMQMDGALRAALEDVKDGD
jgi:hypothetical protein